MFCKWCGMESVTTDQCSWCHRSFGANGSEAETTAELEEDAPAEGLAAVFTPEAAALTPPVASEEPKAPWTIAPPAPTPAPAAAKAEGPVGSEEAGQMPILGIRRPAGKRPAPGHRPAPAMPPPAKPGAATGAGGTRPPAPTAPLTAKRAPGGAAARPHVPAPAAAVPRRQAAPVAAPKAAPPIAASASAAAPLAKSAATIIVTDPAEEIGLAAGQAAPTAPPPPTEANVPQLGTFQPAKSKYYPDQVIDPVSGTHYDAATGTPTATPLTSEQIRERQKAQKQAAILAEYAENQSSLMATIARYLAVFVGLLALTGLVAHFMPKLPIVPLLIGQFVAALLLPVMRAVPWADEDSDDLWFLIGFILIGGFAMTCGPVLALIFYAVLTLIRQDGNPAVFGCLIVAACMRLMVESATGHLGLELFRPFVWKGLGPLFVNWSALITVVGWYAAGIFHKLDE